MSEKKTPKELGTENVGKLLIRYAVPGVISMLAASVYNIVDRIFIGQGVGPLAISGLAVTFPIMNLGASFGAMIGVGGSTLLSIKLGQHDYNTAERVLGNVISLNVIIGFLFSFFAILFIDPILEFFGASENTIEYARTYMLIILYGNIINHLNHGMCNVLRVVGHPNHAMISTLFGVGLNVILDPIFIYDWGLDMGIAGAAWATVLSQTLATIWLAYILSNKNDLIHLKHGIYGLRKRIVRNMISIGISPFCMQLCACMVVILINRGLRDHGGDLAIGAYGIVNGITFMFVMVTLGICQGMQPIAGYNYGAQQYDRVLDVFKKTVWLATIVMTCSFILCEFFPQLPISMFTDDEQLTALSVEGMKLIVLFNPFVGFQIVTGNFFQSLGMPKKSIFLSVSRQLVFLIPMLLILPHYYGTAGVWASIAAADAVSIVTAAVLLWFFFRHGSLTTKNSLTE